MRVRLTVALLAGLLLLGACQREAEAPPPPFAMTEEAMGRYCGMNILEHAGPKGQIILATYDEPIWFSSARDAIAFTMLPEEPKDIRAIYVSDMARAPSWNKPGADNWVDARQAFFVIDSDAKSGMGTAEAVPFSTEAAAVAFAKGHGGTTVRFDAVPRGYILEQQAGGGAQTPSGEVD
ncbi:nitrous oxide reductase accessory protein NosL [Mesorhizobium sp. 2RAF21]|uniref:nitrous oxide reductase accessory protein NosL n=1 Tax=Mesorhizobium sp. 2RAF21 TaxID=3232995 RepID=UPI003F97F4CD